MIASTKHWFGALTLLVLASCSQFHPEQPQGTAIVRMGAFDSTDKGVIDAQKVAGHFAPYALMAYAAYQKPSGDPDWQAFNALLDSKGNAAAQNARLWMREWRELKPGDVREGPLECIRENHKAFGCLGPVGGLAYQIWHRLDCREVVIAFRGTNFSEFNDWITNFHWFLRLMPVYDQYEQVQDHAKAMAEAMRRKCPGSRPELIAVGHSLGGGLAQQLAYMNTPVRRVYAFDPSFVTGSTDVHSLTRESNPNVTTDRVYEHGEILAYPRFLLRQLDPPRACNPAIRSVRFNFINSNVLGDHKMGALAANLVNAAGSPAEWRRKKSRYVLPRGFEADPQNCAPKSPIT